METCCNEELDIMKQGGCFDYWKPVQDKTVD